MMPVTSSSMLNTYSLSNVNAAASNSAEMVKPEALLNRTFVLTKVNGAAPDIMSGRAANLEFDENFRFRAQFDNMIKGHATYENGILKSNGPAISTLMMNGNAENIFNHVLHEGAKVSMHGNTLVLQSNGNELIFE